jgi:outer membrane protein
MKKLLTLTFIALAFSAFSQIKLGHINSAELMQQMPEVEQAQQQLQTESRELEAVLRTMSTDYENLINEFQANQQQMTELIRNTRIRAIQDLESRIQDFRQDADRRMSEMQSNLFTPIIEKAHNAIKDVAKENKYSYIFDTSGGTLLYAIESDDVMELVKKKLNLK